MKDIPHYKNSRLQSGRRCRTLPCAPRCWTFLAPSAPRVPSSSGAPRRPRVPRCLRSNRDRLSRDHFLISGQLRSRGHPRSWSRNSAILPEVHQSLEDSHEEAKTGRLSQTVPEGSPLNLSRVLFRVPEERCCLCLMVSFFLPFCAVHYVLYLPPTVVKCPIPIFGNRIIAFHCVPLYIRPQLWSNAPSQFSIIASSRFTVFRSIFVCNCGQMPPPNFR